MKRFRPSSPSSGDAGQTTAAAPSTAPAPASAPALASNSDSDSDVGGGGGAGPALPPRTRVLRGESACLGALPCAARYGLSYMHADVVTHVVTSASRGFLITASAEGCVKFWARTGGGGKGKKDDARPLEFVKQFRAHKGGVEDMAISGDGGMVVTVCLRDSTAKVFEVGSFDMLGFVKLGFEVGRAAVWIEERRTGVVRFGVAHGDRPAVSLFDPRALDDAPAVVEVPHVAPVVLMEFNSVFGAVVSVDEKGVVDYWMPERLGAAVEAGNLDGIGDYERADGEESGKSVERVMKLCEKVPGVLFDFKGETDLYEFAKKKTIPLSLNISPDGLQFVCMAADRVIRVFSYRRGKLRRSYEESLDTIVAKHSAAVRVRAGKGGGGGGKGGTAADGEAEDGSEARSGMRGGFSEDVEFTRRMQREKEVHSEAGGSLGRGNAIFDSSGNFIIYATLLGIKVVNLTTNKVSVSLGRPEGAERFLTIALFQKAAVLASQSAKKADDLEPLLVATAHDSQRIYLFTRTEPVEGAQRDILNERQRSRRPGTAVGTRLGDETKTAKKNAAQLCTRATLHTTSGDITFTTFQHCPKAVENFSVHARNGYYDNVVFHRVIKGFMVQTGDPDGDGTGGESIWGGEFENEIDDSVKHEKFVLAMANAGGTASQGSQFYILCCKSASHLDGKHTIFGRVVKGMGVVQQIEGVKVDKNDRPLDDIRILSTSVQFAEPT